MLIGDLMVEIDGLSTLELSLMTVVQLLVGPRVSTALIPVPIIMVLVAATFAAAMQPQEDVDEAVQGRKSRLI